MLPKLKIPALDEAVVLGIDGQFGLDVREVVQDLNHPGNTLVEWTHGRVVELADWIRTVRGPQGGPNYRRCHRCRPALPVTYTLSPSDAYPGD
ncbi:hypothetical protein [Micromonospora sp. CA-246542]|uniref:hypothetical protein n=1 Tax=Micromonospora sp. CA-246542 TaxID=3239959 RepID=UPI003D8A7E6B